MAENTPNQIQVPPIKIAFIIDGVIVDILHTDERLAAIFMSEPKAVDITDRLETEGIGVNYLYDEETDTFTAPTSETPQE